MIILWQSRHLSAVWEPDVCTCYLGVVYFASGAARQPLAAVLVVGAAALLCVKYVYA